MAFLGKSLVFRAENIRLIEEKKNAKYLYDSCIRDSRGNWSYAPVAVFYQAELEDPSHKHFFGMYQRDGHAYICDATSAREPFTGIRAEDGTVLYSSYRHDYETYTDSVSNRGYMIDGGREYTKHNGCFDAFVEICALQNGELSIVSIRNAF